MEHFILVSVTTVLYTVLLTHKKLMVDIPNKVRDALGLIVDVDLLSENGLDVIKITVEENPYPVNNKGEYHYRTGSTNQRLQG